MIAPIADSQVLLARGMGMGAHVSLREHGIQPIITDIPDIQQPWMRTLPAAWLIIRTDFIKYQRF